MLTGNVHYDRVIREKLEYMPRDTMDCTIVALAIVRKVTYKQAHKHIEVSCKRKYKKGVYRHDWIPSYASTGLDMSDPVNFPRQMGGVGSRYTQKTIAKLCSTGSWLVLVKGHIFAVVDGVVQDDILRKQPVQQIWRIE